MAWIAPVMLIAASCLAWVATREAKKAQRAYRRAGELLEATARLQGDIQRTSWTVASLPTSTSPTTTRTASDALDRSCPSARRLRQRVRSHEDRPALLPAMRVTPYIDGERAEQWAYTGFGVVIAAEVLVLFWLVRRMHTRHRTRTGVQ